MKFIKKINDKSSMSGFTIMLPVNPGALKKEEMSIIRREFDKVHHITKEGMDEEEDDAFS